MGKVVDKLSLTFAALADPTRRAILDRLSRGEATVNELAKPFDLRLPTVSKHLKVLQRAGLVSQSRKANWRPRRLETAPLKEVASWAERFRERRPAQKQFLCLICADTLLEQMSEAEARRHLAQYRVLTDDLRRSAATSSSRRRTGQKPSGSLPGYRVPGSGLSRCVRSRTTPALSTRSASSGRRRRPEGRSGRSVERSIVKRVTASSSTSDHGVTRS